MNSENSDQISGPCSSCNKFILYLRKSRTLSTFGQDAFYKDFFKSVVNLAQLIS